MNATTNESDVYSFPALDETTGLGEQAFVVVVALVAMVVS